MSAEPRHGGATADVDPQRPLAGLRVVSLAPNLPGPLVVRHLVDLGAQATKVEGPHGDWFRLASEQWYQELIAGVQVLSLDLKSEHGRSELDSLLVGADIFVTSTRPSSLHRLGLGPEILGERFPRLIHAEIVGSITDPEHGGHDLTYQAQTGTLQGTGLPAVLLADQAGAKDAIAATMLALYTRQITGRGGSLRIGLAEAAEQMGTAARVGLTAPGGLLGGRLAGYARYRAAQGEVATAMLEPAFQRRFTELTGLPVDADALGSLFSSRSAAEWESWAAEHDLPIVAVREIGAVDQTD